MRLSDKQVLDKSGVTVLGKILVHAFAWLASTHGRTQPVHTCTPGALKPYYCTLLAVATKNSMLTQMENKHTCTIHTYSVRR